MFNTRPKIKSKQTIKTDEMERERETEKERKFPRRTKECIMRVKEEKEQDPECLR